MVKSLVIDCQVEKLKDIRKFIDNILKGYSVSDELRNLLVLAVDEVCANVIIHSQRLDPSKHLEIKVYYQVGTFVVEVCDSGLPFDPASISEPSLSSIISEKRKGGLGLMLVRRIMDSIETFRENDTTIYRLVKKI
jgi:serine/threonine-protein kinase RsbW